MRPVHPVQSLTPAGWLLVFVGVISILAVFEVAMSVQLLTEQQALPPCQAAQLRASLASDVGADGEEDAMVELANVSLKACALKGFPGLAALTLAHRPFALGINHVYGPNETVEAYAFPAPRTGPAPGQRRLLRPRLRGRGRLGDRPRQPQLRGELLRPGLPGRPTSPGGTTGAGLWGDM